MRAATPTGSRQPVPQPMLKVLERMPRPRSMLAQRRWPLAAALLIAVAAGSAGYLVGSYLQRAPCTEASFVLNAIGAHSVYVPEVRHPVEVKADEEHLIRWLTRASARRSAHPRWSTGAGS